MRYLLQLMVIVSVAAGLAACGTKGKLKTPTQIEAAQAKKARKAAKKEADAAADAEEAAREKEADDAENRAKGTVTSDGGAGIVQPANNMSPSPTAQPMTETPTETQTDK